MLGTNGIFHACVYRTFSSVMGQLVMDDEVMHMIVEESVTSVSHSMFNNAIPYIFHASQLFYPDGSCQWYGEYDWKLTWRHSHLHL